MSTAAAVLDYFQSRLETSLDLLQRLVELESFSEDKEGIDRLADFLATEFRSRGAEARILPDEQAGNALQARWRSASGAGKPVMVLGHLDTVWPAGTVVDRPFRIEDGRASGPGVFDMKSGILLSLLLCDVFRDKGLDPGKDVVFHFTSDEEIGTRRGLPALSAAAAQCRAVLCLEPPLPGGKVKTFRKGVGIFRIRVEGIPAHAGVDHEKGANAIVELSRLAVELQELTDYERGLTVSVGTFHGGTASNVVPSLAEAEVDFRVSTAADGRWMEEHIRSLRSFDPRCNLTVEGGLNRPPLERSPAVLGLYEKAREIGSSIGMQLGEGGTGGGSDGSFTAAMGIPTLDGLGVEGDGAHALHEHIIVSDIPRRAALLTGLVLSL